jgi:hypothetical protein
VSRAWEQTVIVNDAGSVTEALAPVILSASRATDIPALYSEWFIGRLKRGHLAWVNPFNRKVRYISFARARCIIFWSKDPEPLLPHLPAMQDQGIGAAVQFTLNDYMAEGFEPHIPSLDARVDTFSRVSSLLGPERTVWRFDPVLVSQGLGMDDVLGRVRELGDQVYPLTRRLVVSFIDIHRYSWLAPRLARAGIREPGTAECTEFISELSRLCRGWGLRLSLCAEPLPGTPASVDAGGCIDRELIERAVPHSPGKQELLRFMKKDPGQRKECHCIMSRDIGRYNSCTNGCVYCYATRSPSMASRIREQYRNDPCSEVLGGLPAGMTRYPPGQV